MCFPLERIPCGPISRGPDPQNMDAAAPAAAAAAVSGPSVFDIVFPLAALVLIAVAIPVGMLLAARIGAGLMTGRRHGAPARDLPYEAGIAGTAGSAGERFPVRFYLVAMLFLAFDVEVAFLWPWAIRVGAAEGWGIIWAVLPFLLMLEAGFLYLWRKGALDWERSA
jgi:NADH-quinone oxidoreductase subunit A